MSARAEAGHVNRVSGYAGVLELLAIRPPQVEVRALAGSPNEPAVERCPIVPCGSKSVDDLLTHLPATRSKTWTDRGHQICWLAAPFGCEPLDRRRHDPLHGAPPSGVDGRHRASPSIGEENGSAVGDPHDEGDRWVRREDAIRCRSDPHRIVANRRLDDTSPVNLIQKPQAISRHPGEGRKSVPLVLALA